MNSTRIKQTHNQHIFISVYALVKTNLPVLSDGIPHSHFPCVTRGHQLVTNKEESIYRNAKAEHSLNDNEK